MIQLVYLSRWTYTQDYTVYAVFFELQYDVTFSVYKSHVS